MAKHFCGEPVHRTRRLELVWRVSVAHSGSWYQITERDYFKSNGAGKAASPLMKEEEAILLAEKILEDSLKRPWLNKVSRKAMDRLTHAIKKENQRTLEESE